MVSDFNVDRQFRATLEPDSIDPQLTHRADERFSTGHGFNVHNQLLDSFLFQATYTRLGAALVNLLGQ